jgi:hypothetical protein
MGIVRMGVPEDIVLYLKEICDIETFVETGTFHGWTSYWASSHFKMVYTIEFSKPIFEQTIKRHAGLINVEFIFGDSRKELPKIFEKCQNEAIFWLDAHWCSFGSYGEEDQCPLIEELKIILASNVNHCILIDDARLFLSPPALPNSTNFYPTITDITMMMNKSNYHTIIYEDVIVCIPEAYKSDFVKYMQMKITVDDKLYSQKLIKMEKSKQFRRLIKRIIGYKYFVR